MPTIPMSGPASDQKSWFESLMSFHQTDDEGTDIVTIQYQLSRELIRYWIYPRQWSIPVSLQAYPYPKWKTSSASAGAAIAVLWLLLFPLGGMVVDVCKERTSQIRVGLNLKFSFYLYLTLTIGLRCTKK